MLAPRKKLWSSPDVAVEAAITLLAPKPEDVIYDVGCGDGRFLVACALRAGCRCVGLEIDEARAQEARTRAAEAGTSAAIQEYNFLTSFRGTRKALEKIYH